MQPLKIFLDESKCRELLFPFTETRHTADMILGKFTIFESWQRLLPGASISKELHEAALVIPANVIPTPKNVELILQSAKDKVILMDHAEIQVIQHPSQFLKNLSALVSADIYAMVAENEQLVEHETMVYKQPSAKIGTCFFNTENGPIYIDEHARVMEGAMLNGPIYVGKHSTIKMGAKLYGPVSIAENCSIGGEVSNSIFFNYSNKGHDGYIGTSIIGAWCNLGAGTSCSNVKNTGGKISYALPNGSSFETGEIKAGLLMGDYSRAAINTSFNTAATVGVSCNIFGTGTNQKLYQNFTWGNEKYLLEKAIEHTNNWMAMKGKQLSEQELSIINKLYNQVK